MSPAQPGWRLAVDFGTTATCVATRTDDGPEATAPAQLVSHGMTGTRYPSAVYATDERLVSGPLATNQAAGDPARFEPTPKRAVSRGDRVLALAGGPVRVVDAVAAVIRDATAPAVAAAGRLPTRVTLTHPAAWRSAQLPTLRAAAEAAGLGGDVDLVAEPVAAAWAVVPDERRQAGSRYALFDWGGGTFDAAVVTWTGGRFELAGPPRGVDPLGGEDVDEALWRFVLERARAEDQERLERPASNRDRRDARELRRNVRIAKETLSELVVTGIPVGDDTVTVTRAELDALAGPLVAECLDALTGCLGAAGVRADQLAGVWLVGDASRMPLVHRQVWEELRVEPHLPPDAKGVVALGAASSPAPTAASQDRRERGEAQAPRPHLAEPPPPPELAGQRWRPGLQVSVSAIGVALKGAGEVTENPTLEAHLAVAFPPGADDVPHVGLMEMPGALELGSAAEIAQDPVAFFRAFFPGFEVRSAEVVPAFGGTAWLVRGERTARLLASGGDRSWRLDLVGFADADVERILDETVGQEPREPTLLRYGFSIDPWVPTGLSRRVAKIHWTWPANPNVRFPPPPGSAPIARVVFSERGDLEVPSTRALHEAVVAEALAQNPGLVPQEHYDWMLFGGKPGRIATFVQDQLALLVGTARVADRNFTVEIYRNARGLGLLRRTPNAFRKCEPLLNYVLLDPTRVERD